MEPIEQASTGGHRHLLTLIDKLSHYDITLQIESRAEVSKLITNTLTQMENHHRRHAEQLHSDNEKEYTTHSVQ